MCDYPITPLPPRENDPYNLYAESNGNTVEQQMEADTFTCDNGTKVVRYIEFVRWLFKMRKAYILYQAIYNHHADVFYGIDEQNRFHEWLKSVIEFNRSQQDVINRRKQLDVEQRV